MNQAVMKSNVGLQNIKKHSWLWKDGLQVEKDLTAKMINKWWLTPLQEGKKNK